ncbi:MAG TPA: glycoside hydrolase family 43 protein [Candidatus Mediterraneibacter ornithocaccae]|nr:glycoside hydrolase family 43 protein [Candidatus Mediterraneibacter ornithocaccae]
MVNYENPIIPGFHPDPSICRAGNDYFLVNSSFEFFPGIPLFHSRDLIHWKQLGYVLTRRSQADLSDENSSKGIWAPTIRVHDGRFYVSATNMSHGGNFFVYTDDIYGEWSDPIWVKQGGIDASLYFDDDGQVYFSSTYDMPGSQAIGQSRIDIQTGKLLTETKVIWHGSGGKYPEGPHMYKKDGWYYLLAAEGGTEYGHMITIARGYSPWGPFESCPDNPILTHRDTMLDQFQAVGHGDIIETQEGDWWIVFHGIRTTQYMFHHLGRETMISPMEWTEEGWPVINKGKIITPQMSAVKLPGDSISEPGKRENTDSIGQEQMLWNFIKNPDPSSYDILKNKRHLLGTDVTLNDAGSPTFIGRRQEHFYICAEVKIECRPQKEEEYAGITVYHTNEHHYDFGLIRHEGKYSLMLRKHAGDMETRELFILPGYDGECVLRVESDKLEYRFLAGIDGKHMKCFGRGRTQMISSECMVMTFTGCYIGIFAEKGAKAVFEILEYTGNDSC